MNAYERHPSLPKWLSLRKSTKHFSRFSLPKFEGMTAPIRGRGDVTLWYRNGNIKVEVTFAIGGTEGYYVYSCSTFVPDGVGGQRAFRPHYPWKTSVSVVQEATWAPGRISTDNGRGVCGLFMQRDIVKLKLCTLYLNIPFPIVTSSNKYCGFST
jgi:hypothetical protein